MRTATIEERIGQVPFWYHRIELPDGITTPGWAPLDANAYRLPERMDGERILDVGAWDGYWTFEALKRGASFVVAIDDFSDQLGKPGLTRENKFETFELCREALGFERKCMALELDIYNIDQLKVAPFDRIFCFGVLYHLRHPLLALDKLRAMCSGTIHIESAVLDHCQSPYTGEGIQNGACHAEFYPGSEFGSNPSNWWVPTLKCLGSMVEAAGFSDVQTWKLTDYPMHASHCRGFASGVVA